MNWIQLAFLLLWTDICLSLQALGSCLNLPSSCSLPPPFSVFFPLLGTRQGFLKSGLSSGKTRWPAARMSYNLSSHVVKSEDVQKDRGWKQKIKWVEGGKARRPRQMKAEEPLGLSWGEGPPPFPQVTYFSLSLPPSVIFLVPTCCFQTCSDFPQGFGWLRNRKM